MEPHQPLSGVLCVLQATRAALAVEEPRVARLQAQLKELIIFPHDPQPLSDSVVSAIQEYQRYLGRLGVGSGMGLCLDPHTQGVFFPQLMPA